jgi:hypothetical protein
VKFISVVSSIYHLLLNVPYKGIQQHGRGGVRVRNSTTTMQQKNIIAEDNISMKKQSIIIGDVTFGRNVLKDISVLLDCCFDSFLIGKTPSSRC